MLTVHVRVTDGSSGRITPVRLRLVSQGAYRPPLGRLAEFATDPGVDVGDQVLINGEAHALIDGACEVPLPPGEVSVRISKGPEYLPVEQTLRLAPGRMALRFSIERWADWRGQGWFAGDVRAHDLSPHAALLEGEAEGLAVVALLARELPPSGDRPGSMRNVSAFSGRQAALSSADCLVAVNTFNVHPVLGQVGLLNCHRPVYPLRSGRPGLDDWSVTDWCEQCRRKKGLVSWPAPALPSDEATEGEGLAALILGKIDAFEVNPFSGVLPESLPLYYLLLDCGFRPALVAGSGKESNRGTLGSVRTYARLAPGATLTADTWIEAVRAGRTFITAAPLVSLRVDRSEPGGVVRADDGQPVLIRAEASSATPLERLEVVAGGEVVAAATPAADRRSAVLEVPFLPLTSTWLAARCVGADGSAGFAHTSPIGLEVAGRPLRPRPGRTEPLLGWLRRCLGWVEGAARCPSERHRDHLKHVLQAAVQELHSRVDGEAGGVTC